MNIEVVNKKTKQVKQYNLEDINITGNPSEESEVCVTGLKCDDFVDIYTSDNVYMTKFKKLIEANPDAWKIVNVVERNDGTISGVMLQASKKCLSFRAGKESERVYTEEQRNAMAERLRKMRSEKE